MCSGPNRERFHPPNEWKAIGTGIGTLMPTMPAATRRLNSRAAPPSRVKMEVPLPNSWRSIRPSASSRLPNAQHDEHRAEDLLAVDAHRLGDAVEQHRAHEESLLVAGDGVLAPVDDELRAFLDAGLDVAEHALAMLARDERAHVGAFGRAGQDLDRRELGLQRRDQPVARIADGDGDRDRHAALAGGAVGRARERVRDGRGIRIRHDDHVVLGAAERLHALAGLRARAIHVLGDRRRADEADRVDAWIGEQACRPPRGRR